MNRPTLLPCLTFRDADRGIDFLKALGFSERACYRDDTGVVVHAQLAWGDAGGVMLGASGRRDPGDRVQDAPGTALCYCVVSSDDAVDAVYERALGAGGSSVQAPADPDYGGRCCTVADPEGNQWSFGSYRGE